MAFWDFFFVVFIAIPLFIAWIYTVVDIFMRPDVSALGKFGWLILVLFVPLILVLFVPLIGMLIYFIARPDSFEIAAKRRSDRHDDSLAASCGSLMSGSSLALPSPLQDVQAPQPQRRHLRPR